MKTKATLLYLLTLLLTVFSVQTAQAQAVQDALYIYRNDGQLNAFFYGDIDHFEYSKTDTLGVEQPDYVVQEVYTLDTLYRIPISAIDSVAFVTPETKIKADVFCPDKSIVNYITASDSVYWILLAKNTPASLIPKVGSKLLIEEEGKFIPDGFGGLVDAVQETSNGYKVTTSALALTDIYEQLVIKAAGASPNMARARTRVLDGADIEVPEVEIKIPPVSATLALKYSKAFLPENDYVEFNGELQGSLSSAISTKMRVRAFLTITPFTGFRYYQETFIDEDIENAATLSGSLSGRLEVPFLPKPTHKFSIGKLKFELGLGLFLEAQATALSLSYKHSKTEKTRINMTFDHTDIAVTPVGPVFDPFFRWSSYCEKDTTEWEFDSTGQYSLGFGVFAKAETKFKVPIEKMPKFVQAWSKKSEFGFEASFGVDVGTKTEYAGPLVKTVPELLQTPPFYAELNKANMSVSAYAKLGASLGCGNWGVEYSPEAKFWEPINRGLVPDLQGLDVSQDTERPIRPYRLLFKSPTSDKKVLTGTKVGFAVFDAEEKLVKDTLNAFYWISSNEDEWIWKKKKSTNECVMILDPGKDDYISYTAYPMVEFMGHKVLADQKYEFKLDPARIEIAERIISAGSDLGSMEIEVIPNMANVEVKAEADWLNKISPAWLPHKNQLTVYWPDLPEGVKERRGVVRLIGKSQKGEKLVEDSIVVHQFIPYIELTPDKLEFEAKGGTQTVTVGKTNLTDLKVKTSSDYLTLKFEGNTITVTMNENKTSEERGATIYVEGKTPDGKTDDYAVITVYQEAASGGGQQGGGEGSGSFGIKELSQSAYANFICENPNEIEDFEQDTEIMVSGGILIDGSSGRKATATVIDENTIHIDCSQLEEFPDEEEPELKYRYDRTFSADIHRIFDADGNRHLIARNVHYNHVITQTYHQDKYEVHFEFVIENTNNFHVYALPGYDEDTEDENGNPIHIHLDKELYINGDREHWGLEFSELNYTEEFRLNNGKDVYKYKFKRNPKPKDSFNLHIVFNDNSTWGQWIGEDGIYDPFGYQQSRTRTTVGKPKDMMPQIVLPKPVRKLPIR